MREDSEKRRDVMLAEMERLQESRNSEKKQAEDEERQFKPQLLAELQKHNAFLEQILTRYKV